ncbi:MAG: hypothetical protein ACHQVS_03185 [Candidatus Babeliales bacterium]
MIHFIISLAISTSLVASDLETLRPFVPFPELPDPLPMIICNQPLVLFSNLEKHVQDATHNYFGKPEDSALCARFMPKELGDKQKEHQYCEYVPVTMLHNKQTIITMLYKQLTFVPDSDGEKPQERIERLCKAYEQSKKKAEVEKETQSASTQTES